MFEKILVPLDGSDLAEVALPYAEELSKRLGSGLVLFYAGDPDRSAHQEYLERLQQKIRRHAQKQQAKYPNAAIPIPDVEIVVIDGNPAEGIVDYAADTGIDLTIMATHGRSGLSRWAMGSVADRVVRAISRPVCLIRASGSNADVRPDCLISRIFVPMDGSKPGEATLPYVETLAQKTNTEVVLFQLVDKREECGNEVNWMELRNAVERNAKTYLRRLEANLINKGIAVRTIVEFGTNPDRHIVDLAERTQSAVVVMSTHGRSGVNRLMFGSIAEKVLRSGTTPLLLVRSPGSEPETAPVTGAHCTVNLST